MNLTGLSSCMSEEKVSPGTSLGREGEGETERVLGFKMSRFGHSDDHPERREDHYQSGLPMFPPSCMYTGYTPQHGNSILYWNNTHCVNSDCQKG